MTQKELFYISRKNYEKIYGLSSDDYAKALLAFEKNEYEKAREILEGIKEQSPYVLLQLLYTYTFIESPPPPPEKIREIINKLLGQDYDEDFTFDFAFILVSYSFYEEADTLIEKLLGQKSYDENIWFDCALAYKFVDNEKAIALLERAYEHFSAYKQEILENEGDLSEEGGKRLDSIDDFIAMRVLVELAHLNFRLYRYENALDLFANVENYNAKNPYFFISYALALEYTGHYDKAYECYKRAITLHTEPFYCFEFSKFCLRLGNFEEGFLHYETRLSSKAAFTFSKRHYDAAYAAFYGDKDFLHGKKVLVYCEQGYGDTLMFGRILRRLCKVAKEVIFCPQPALFTLFDTHIKTLQKQNKIQNNLKIVTNLSYECDYAVPICSLYLFLSFYNPKSIANLSSPLISVEKRTRTQKAKIGICFRTKTPVERQAIFFRNIDLDFLLQAFEGLDVELINFTLYEKGELELPTHINDISFELKDWLATSEALRDVDLLVSIDSAIAHLALALGIPTLVLLGDRFDWRWGKIENPKSIFWQKAHLCVVNKDGPSGIRQKICELLKLD
ncbi:hypothetical protein, partial [Campylobacter vulpis]|uniref:hypothetical protein n=2 Tax=Campylobacter vulpis TaxID=1655500 RepID=UPI001BCE64EB